jgi:hypothetical protein
MAPPRSRRRVVILGLIAGLIVVVGAYRRRALARNAEDFDARYG